MMLNMKSKQNKCGSADHYTGKPSFINWSKRLCGNFFFFKIIAVDEWHSCWEVRGVQVGLHCE
jgi:hypothetical protein